MPSWYVVFLAAVAGVVLVVGRRRSRAAAFAAGRLIGLAALAKVTAAFAPAGGIWALVALRQDQDRSRRDAVEILVAALIFSGLVIRLVDTSLTGRVIAHLVVPPLAVTASLAWREFRQGRARGFGVDRELWLRIGALAVGAAAPIVIFAWWLAQHDALTPFIASLGSVVGRCAAQAWLPRRRRSCRSSAPCRWRCCCSQTIHGSASGRTFSPAVASPSVCLLGFATKRTATFGEPWVACCCLGRSCSPWPGGGDSPRRPLRLRAGRSPCSLRSPP
ncbi:MAG: hypothetical protein ACRELE_05790 [Gemmatimonadales bacterium]